MHAKSIALLLSLFILLIPVHAQDALPEITPEPSPLPEPQVVTVDALDGLDLEADFYLIDPARPTVLLLHQMYTNRTSWDPLLLPLIANGYNVLAPDIRGWGETRGAINWFKALDDVAVWLAWLRDEAQVNPEAIHTIGSSMGSSLAIVSCANDELCRSAVAISPGWDYYRVRVDDSITERAVLGIYALNDRWPALGVPRMIEIAPETFVPLSYEGNAHGMDLIEREQETVIVAIIDWLNNH
ncbi:MAG: alpha/beta hydrolase family protein [Anaerolineae bacterium]